MQGKNCYSPKLISRFDLFFFDTIRHLQLKHKHLAKYNDLAK